MYLDVSEAQKNSSLNTMEVLIPDYSDTQTHIGVRTKMIVTPHQDMFS